MLTKVLYQRNMCCHNFLESQSFPQILEDCLITNLVNQVFEIEMIESQIFEKQILCFH